MHRPPRRQNTLGPFRCSRFHSIRAGAIGSYPFPDDMKTKLQFRRSSDRLLLTCPVMFSGMPSIGEGLTLNVSSQGCTVEGMSTVLDGSYMKLRVFLPDSHSSLRVELAAVRWVLGPYFGVEFLRLPIQDRSRLDQFLHDFRFMEKPSRQTSP